MKKLTHVVIARGVLMVPGDAIAKAGNIADTTVMSSLIAAVGDTAALVMVVTVPDDTMDIAAVSSLTAVAEIMGGGRATGIMLVDDITGAETTSWLTAAVGNTAALVMVITVPDDTTVIADTSTLTAVGEVMGGGRATGIMQVGDITGTEIMSLLIAARITVQDDIMHIADTSSLTAVGEVMRGDTATGVKQVGDITGTGATSLPIAVVEADLTTVTTDLECIIDTTGTNSLTVKVGDMQVTGVITTHYTLPDAILDIGGTGSLTTAVGAAVAGASVIPQAGVARDRETTSITLDLATRPTTARKISTRKMEIKKRMVSRPQALDRVGLALRSLRECWNTAIRIKTAN